MQAQIPTELPPTYSQTYSPPGDPFAPVGFLPDTLLGIELRFESARVGDGRRVRLMMPRTLSMPSREGFWPENVRKKADRYEAKG
jgi:hypothetical protein